MHRALLLVLVATCCTLSCTGKERRVLSSSGASGVTDNPNDNPNDNSATNARADKAGANAANVSPVPAEPASEAVARALLAERFRAAGFRIRHDVTVTVSGSDGIGSDGIAAGFGITVDGYDPESRVGFEYVAVDERDTDLQPDERAALERHSEYRILVVDAAAPPDVEAAAERFLGDMRSNESRPSQ